MYELEDELRANVQEALFDYSVFRTSYSDLKEYYSSQPNERSWIGALAQALTNSPDRSSKNKEYRSVRRSIEYIEQGRSKGFSKRRQEDLRRLGERLPPKSIDLHGKTLTVTVFATVGISDDERDRRLTVPIPKNELHTYAKNPNWDDTLRIYFGQQDPTNLFIPLEVGARVA